MTARSPGHMTTTNNEEEEEEEWLDVSEVAFVGEHAVVPCVRHG